MNDNSKAGVMQFNIVHGHTILLQPDIMLCDHMALEKSLNFRKLVNVSVYKDLSKDTIKVILGNKILDRCYSLKTIYKALAIIRDLDLIPEFYTLPDENYHLVIKTTRADLNFAIKLSGRN